MTVLRVLVPVKRSLAQLRRTVNRRRGPQRLLQALQRSESPRIIIGSGALHLRSDWIETDKEFLDLLAPGDWRRFFRPNSIAALLAEHVWEPLPLEQGRAAAAR